MPHRQCKLKCWTIGRLKVSWKLSLLFQPVLLVLASNVISHYGTLELAVLQCCSKNKVCVLISGCSVGVFHGYIDIHLPLADLKISYALDELMTCIKASNDTRSSKAGAKFGVLLLQSCKSNAGAYLEISQCGCLLPYKLDTHLLFRCIFLDPFMIQSMWYLISEARIQWWILVGQQVHAIHHSEICINRKLLLIQKPMI